MMSMQRTILLAGLLVLALGLAACSDSTDPPAGTPETGSVFIAGQLNPTTGEWVLKTLDTETPYGRPLRIQLVASNLTVDHDAQLVSLDVAIRNLQADTLYGPAAIWLNDFNPVSVHVLNADFVTPAPPDGPLTGEMPPSEYGFDYARLLGGDNRLAPGETSAAKTWLFATPDMVSFAFAARAEFGMLPDPPRIAGLCWRDANRNGVQDPGEEPWGLHMVVVTPPSGEAMRWLVGPDGRFEIPVRLLGLYQLLLMPAPDVFGEPVGFSTPNPRQVFLVPDADGRPRSFLDADFGLYIDTPPPPGQGVQFTDLPPDSLHFGSFMFLDLRLDPPFNLVLEVGYSGCDRGHPFSLWMTGGFMESEPVQAQLVLVHEVEQDCTAYFTDTLMFNLEPVWTSYLDTYGPGLLELQVMDSEGTNHALLLPVFPPD